MLCINSYLRTGVVWGSTDGKFCLCLLKIQNKIIQIIVFECVVEGQSVS